MAVSKRSNQVGGITIIKSLVLSDNVHLLMSLADPPNKLKNDRERLFLIIRFER